MQGSDPTPWGTLAEWLDADPETRPELPEQLLAAGASGGAAGTCRARRRLGSSSGCTTRWGGPAIGLWVLPVDTGPRQPPFSMDLARSHRGLAVVMINRDHPLGKLGLADGGRSRELLLLEAARQVCAWGVPMGLTFDLLRAQFVLLGQRIEG